MPMLRLCWFFALGIIIERFVPNSEEFLFITNILLISIGFHFRKQVISGLLLFIFTCTTGMWVYRVNQPGQSPLDYTRFVRFNEPCKGCILSGHKTNTGFRYEVDQISSTKMKCTSGKLMLYTLKGEEWHPGQYISFLYHGSVPENNPLPGGFDNSTWLKQKSIHRVQFTQKYEIICTLNTINYPRRLIFRIQKGIQEVYKTYLKNKVTRGLIEALIFGIKDELEESTTKIYADTGTIHVLAVSGLHVGLLFMGMQLITKPIRKKWPKFAIQMAGLWLYVFICGAEPSILRAGIMLSVVAWGKGIKKNTGVFNNLGLAGILILLFQPNELFNAGFLLSFLAVGGIAWLHPVLCRILAFKNTYLQKIYEFSMVTLAAQIITLPVTIHLFHRFPTYFLISNLLIIPLTTLITFGGIILLLISPIKVASELLGDLIEKTIGLCNAIAQHMSQWPGAIINDIYITIPELIFLSAAVIYCILAFGDICKHYLKIAIVMATMFYMSHTARICIQEIQSENISLTYHKTTIQLFIRGRHAKAYIQFYNKRTPKTIHNIYSFLKERGIREIILTEKTNFPDKFQP